MTPEMYRRISQMEMREKIRLLLREWFAIFLGAYLAWIFSVIQIESYTYSIERTLSQIAAQRIRPSLR